MGLGSWLSRLLVRGLLVRGPLLHIAGDVGDGPAVVLLHGIASSSVTFEYVVPLINDRHRAVSIDLLGFGGSPAPEDATYMIEEHVAALHRTLRHARLRSFVLVGHSMGALIAARYAANHPRAVSGLVLVSPPIYLAPSEMGAPLDRAAMGLYFRLYEFLRANKQFTIRAAAGLARLAPIKNLLDVSETSWNPFVLSLEKSIESQTALSDLAQVQVPIHLVYGTLDPFLHPAGLRLVESLRGVTAHRVQGIDHVIRPRMARVVATAIG
jgi:pimeloyl-ACP methyl ester carboxylesterase